MADKPVLTRKFNEALDTDALMREGGILARIYLGVQGNDKEAAKKALESTVNTRLAKEEHIRLLEVNMYDILKEKKDYFSGVSDVRLIAEDFRWFVNMILRYGPSAVEIIEPEDVRLNMEQMHSLAADVCDFSHMYSEQIIAMFKDPERRALYERMLKGG